AHAGGALDLRVEVQRLVVGTLQLAVRLGQTGAAHPIGVGQDGGEDADDVEHEQVEGDGDPRHLQVRHGGVVVERDAEIQERRDAGGGQARGAREHEPGIDGDDGVDAQVLAGGD